jgi:NADH dehydrogenase
MAVVGRSWAVADIGRLQLSGRPAWVVWAVVHIAFLVGFQNRLETMRRWLWDITYRRRSERVISAVSLLDPAIAYEHLERSRSARTGGE